MIKLIIGFLYLIGFSITVTATPIVEVIPELTFPSAVEVSPRSIITAFDVVEARNLNSKIENELKKIKLGDEKTNRLEKNQLVKLLRAIKAKFYLPSEIKFLRSRTAVSRMEVERKVKNQVLKNCSDCDLQINISSVPSSMPSDWNLDFNVDLNRNSVNIPISSSSSSDKKGWVIAELRRYQLVPVLNRPVRMGEVVESNMISMETRQIVNPRETVLTPKALVGVQAARYLNPGQALAYGDFKKEQVLKKGQVVKAIIGSSEFEVAIVALAEEAGALGDVVKVKNIDSQKVVAGKIIERGVVRVD